MKRHIIYGLIDPRNGLLRYIGRSSSGLKRPRQHWESKEMTKTKRYHSTRWIKTVLDSGHYPEIILLEEHESSDTLNVAEMFWVFIGRKLGLPLTNMNNGGEGQQGFHHSDETKQKIGQANKNNIGYWKGKKLLKAAIEKMSATKKARFAINPQPPPTDEVRERIRASQPNKTPLIDQYGNVYESQCFAARHFGVQQGYIQAVLRSSGKSVRGHFLKKLIK